MTNSKRLRSYFHRHSPQDGVWVVADRAPVQHGMNANTAKHANNQYNSLVSHSQALRSDLRIPSFPCQVCKQQIKASTLEAGVGEGIPFEFC